MNLQRFLPTDPLKPFVRAFLLIESATGTENRLVPDTAIVLAFRYKGVITDTREGQTRNLPFSAISGLRKSARLIRYAGDTATLLVLFREGGAAAFFREPLHELFGLSLPLDELIGRRALTETEDRLAEATSHAQRIALVERFLLSRLHAPRPEPLIGRAVSSLQTAHGRTGIKPLAESLALSQDAFEKRFRRAVGATPKQFASILRFRHLLTMQTPDRSLTDLAYEAGYFDQAHFIKDFRAFTGQAPHDFFKTGRFW